MNERRQDFECLQRFVRQGDQEAFSELARRHLDLVYGTALRKLEDSSAAEEVAQNVFAALARKAWRFGPEDSLPAWLHKTALLESKQWLRGELRRRRREQTAAALGTAMKNPNEQPALRALIPMLDEALLSLAQKDRTALLLRYYEGRSFRELSAALGIGEDAAQKRVAAAVERVAQFFQRRGFRTATSAATSAALQQTVATAPAAAANVIMHTVAQITPPSMAGLTALASRLISLTRMEKAAICLVLLAVPAMWHWVETARGKKGQVVAALQGQVASSQEPSSSGPESQPTREALLPQRRDQGGSPPPPLPSPKEYTAHVRGTVQVADFAAVLVEIRHHSFERANSPALVWHKVLVADRPFDDRSVKDQYVRFELMRVDAQNGAIQLSENGELHAYQLEEAEAVNLGASDPLPPICMAKAAFDDFLDLYAELLDRTLLIHPQLQSAVTKRLPISFGAVAQSRAEAVAVFKRTLRDQGIWTLRPCEHFAVLVTSNLVKTIQADMPPLPRAQARSEQNIHIPAGSIYLKSVALADALLLYGDLIGRTPAQEQQSFGALVSFRNQTALSKAEVIYAFDVLWEWEGLKVMLLDNRRFKVVPLH